MNRNHKIGLGVAVGLLVTTVSSNVLAQERLRQPTISSVQAIQTVLNRNPGTFATELELDRENRVLVYEVELNNGRQVKVNANNGQIINVDQNDDDDDNGIRRTRPQIGINRAIQTVLASNPRTFVEEVKLERENGVLVYKVELNNDRDVTVNANSGRIIRTEDDD